MVRTIGALRMAFAALTKAARARSTIWAAAAIAVMLIAASRYAYFRIFSAFAPYDDEGYILQTVRSYLDGAPLYDAVYSQYGPAFYTFHWILHGILRVPLDHDAFRILTIGYWLAAIALASIVVYRVTRSVPGCVLAGVLCFPHLAPIINEPGHPQGILLVVVLLTCAVAANTERLLTVRGAVCCAALAAFAMLVKVNVGVFLAIAIAVPLVIASPLPRIVGLGAIAAAAAVPLLLMRVHLPGLVTPYAVVASTSVLAIGVQIDRWLRGAHVDRRVLTAFCISGVAMCAGLVLVAILGGTSLSALIRSVILDPSRFAGVFFLPAILPRAAIGAGLAGLALSVMCRWPAVARSAVASAILTVVRLLGIVTVIPGLQGGYDRELAFLTPSLWLLLAPDVEMTPAARFARGCLAFVAALQTLQAYPVAGSQVAFSAVLLVVSVVIALDDGLRGLGRRWITDARRMAVQGIVAAAVVYLAWPVASEMGWTRAYRRGYELRLPGAEGVRLTRDEVARYQWLAGTAASRCRSLTTVPGLYSLNAWSGVATPTHLNATAWLLLLTPAQQEHVWTSALTSPASCVILNRALSMNWLGARTLASVGAEDHLKQLIPLVASDGFEMLTNAREPGDVDTTLFAGRQSFSRTRTPLPVSGALLQEPAESTTRLWMRTRQNGVLVGCQSTEREIGRPPQSFPLLYIGRSGRLVGQWPGGGAGPEAVGSALNDGAWHHIALVRTPHHQSLYVDGTLARAIPGDVWTGALERCQAGVGFTSGSPDGSEGWMTFTGEMTALRVARSAWSAERVAGEWRSTRP